MMNRDWSVSDSNKSFSSKVTPVSGYMIYLYQATREQKYLDQINRILEVTMKNMVDDESGWILEDFDGNWKYLQGREDATEINIGHNIEADRNFIPAYTSLAELDIRQLRYSEAKEKPLLALGFDTCDPDANFLYGTLLEKYGEYLKAKDAYGITLTSQKYRMASLNRLALVALKEKKYYCT